jgi:hypothetical protein
MSVLYNFTHHKAHDEHAGNKVNIFLCALRDLRGINFLNRFESLILILLVRNGRINVEII